MAFPLTFSFPSAKVKGQKGRLFTQHKESLYKIKEMNHFPIHFPYLRMH